VITRFLRSDTTVIYFAAHFHVATIRWQLLFGGDVYSYGKPTNINHGWIRYKWT